MFEILRTVLEQSLIFGLLALGSYISYKILNFPDLSVEGTFPLGAACSAILITNGVNPFLSCLCAMALGALGGMITGLIHVKLKITDILSGIVVLTALYSINLIIAGKANVPIFDKETIFSINIAGNYSKLVMALIIFIVIKIIMDIYMKTRSGFLLRSAGDNVSFVTSLGKDVGSVKILGLSIANSLAALSGAIWCQYQRYFDVGMGRSVIIVGLASVIIGTNIFKGVKRMKGTTMALLGCLIYTSCVTLAIFIGVNSDYINLFIAVLFLSSLVLSGGGSKFLSRRSQKC